VARVFAGSAVTGFYFGRGGGGTLQLGCCFSSTIWAEKRKEFNAFNGFEALNNPC
jgi:hypothetical protein